MKDSNAERVALETIDTGNIYEHITRRGKGLGKQRRAWIDRELP